VAEVGSMTWEEMVLSDSGLQLAPFGEIVRELRADLGLSTPAP
jgi:hypothetical protein